MLPEKIYPATLTEGPASIVNISPINSTHIHVLLTRCLLILDIVKKDATFKISGCIGDDIPQDLEGQYIQDKSLNFQYITRFVHLVKDL